MIGDPAGASQSFSDDEIGRALDANREDVRSLELTAAESVTDLGEWECREYYAPYGAWETSATLKNAQNQTLTPSESELEVGVWRFGVNTPAPVYVTGRVFDLAAAAADLLDMKLARIGSGFDFSVDGLSVNTGNQSAALRGASAAFRSQQRMKVVKMVREDELHGRF